MDLRVSDSESDRPVEQLASTYSHTYIVIELEKHPTDDLYFLW